MPYGIATPTILGQKIIGGLLPMEDSAREPDAFVTRVLRSTGASKVDLVEHSEGTVMPEYWLQFLGGAARTDRVVAVAAAYATNIVVQDGCDIDLSDHLSIIASERTGRIILNALDPAHASPPPCGLSLPALGDQILPPLL